MLTAAVIEGKPCKSHTCELKAVRYEGSVKKEFVYDMSGHDRSVKMKLNYITIDILK